MINYTTTQTHLTNTLQIMKKRSFIYSIMRMSAMILSLIFVWLAQRNDIFYGLAFTFLVIFLILVYIHNKLKNQMLFMETQVRKIKELSYRQDDRWKENAKDSTSIDDSLLSDLDICGKASLMDYINMAHTPYGKEYLISLFQMPGTQTEIQTRQEAVQELLKHPEELLDLQTYSALFAQHSRKIKKEILEELIQNASIPIREHQWLYLIHVVMSVITTGLFIVCFFDSKWFDILWIMISINIILVMISFTKNHGLLQEVSVVKDSLEDYLDIMTYFDQIHLESTYILALQKEINGALVGIRKLLRISQLTKLRSNLLTNLFFNGLFQLDFHCIHQLAVWKQHNGLHLRDWFLAIAKLEALTSLCVIGQVKDNYSFPTIINDQLPKLTFMNMQHPLIHEDKAIPNSLAINNETYIITGSNMSGKTTFLRTIGVNSLLAFAGAPTCAQQFEISMMDIYSSMRIKDDVSEGISTFYAELLSIKRMMDAAKKERPMMVLIDEIFKGTNSADRILCAREAICRLHEPWIITMVSTHDFELCTLEQDNNVHARNYHFEEYYEHDEIRFDYELKNGKCTTTNARQLMKLAGF